MSAASELAPDRLWVWDWLLPVGPVGQFMSPALPPPTYPPSPTLTLACGVVCVWLGICATLNVVTPTVPETPGHHPQPRVCQGSDADHILPGVVWRQVAGAARCTGKRVGVGLRPTEVL